MAGYGQSDARQKIPLFALESQDPVKDFDFLGITIQYEMCYTNILQILDLSGISLLAEKRTWDDPIVIGGGPCTYNPEPLAQFFDIFYIGEGETVYFQLMDLYKEERAKGSSRMEFLKKAAQIPGLYVPALYEVCYKEDGTIASFTPLMHPFLHLSKNRCYGYYRHVLSKSSCGSIYQGHTGSCGSGDPAWLYPRMPFLSGRYALPSDQRA